MNGIVESVTALILVTSFPSLIEILSLCTCCLLVLTTTHVQHDIVRGLVAQNDSLIRRNALIDLDNYKGFIKEPQRKRK